MANSNPSAIMGIGERGFKKSIFRVTARKCSASAVCIGRLCGVCWWYLGEWQVTKIPVFVMLGDFTSGVTSWGFRLREAFQGHPVYRIHLVNCCKTGNRMGRFDQEATSPEAVYRLLKRFPRAIAVPNFVFEAYPLCAQWVREGHDLSTIGFCRADSEREYYEPLKYFEPAISQFAAVSPECKTQLAQYIPQRADDIAVMPTGVLVPQTLDRDYQTSPIRLVYGGRIVQVQKRVMDFVPLVEALLARKVDFTFDIAGQGRSLEDLQAAMGEVAHEGRVTFLGKVLPEKMPALWRAHDVFIQTSEFEGTSNSMLESMAQGAIPVLTYTESGLDGILRPGENGFSVPVGEMEGMADLIASLSRQSPAALARLGQAAHEVTREYSIEKYVERFSQLLDRALAAPPITWPEGRPAKPEFEVHGIALTASEKPDSALYETTECLKNSGFQTDVQPGLTGWTATPGLVASGKTGEVELQSGPRNTFIQQACNIPSTPGEGWLEASCEIWAEDPEAAGFNCYVSGGGLDKTYSTNHPGGGGWHSLFHKIPLPPGKTCQVRFFVVLRSGASHPIRVRKPSLKRIASREIVPPLAPFRNAPIPPLGPGQKRLLILFPSPIRGGAEDYCVAMARGALNAGWQVHAAFAPRQGTASLIRDFCALGAQYHPLDVVDVGYKAGRAMFHKRFTRTWRALGRIQPDVVLLELCGAQYGIGPMAACMARNVPAGIVFQMVRDNRYFTPPERWFRAAARNRGQQYIAVSEQNRDLIAEMFHMRAEAIEVVPNGANPAIFAYTEHERVAGRAQLREELGFPGGTRLLLTVGRLSPQKGHDLLVPVMAHVIERYPDVRFIWAGEGPSEKDLKALLEQHGVAKFTVLLGRRNDIPRLLNCSDLFVHPTRFEGQPFSMLEAMAAGLPIVTTRASGITEVLEDRVHGLLGRVEDIRDLRENLFFALGHPGEMQMMAQRARLRLEAFTEERMIERTLELLKGLCR